MIVNGPNLRFEGTFAEILALDLNSLPMGSTFWATDLPRVFGVQQLVDGRSLYIFDDKARSLKSDLNRKLARADDYVVGSTAVDDEGKRYVVRLNSEGDHCWQLLDCAPEPRYSVYVLWSHHGWALAADNLDEDQAEAKRADVISSEYDDDHELILAAEVFPMGTTPGQLGVPPKEIA